MDIKDLDRKLETINNALRNKSVSAGAYLKYINDHQKTIQDSGKTLNKNIKDNINSFNKYSNNIISILNNIYDVISTKKNGNNTDNTDNIESLANILTDNKAFIADTQNAIAKSAESIDLTAKISSSMLSLIPKENDSHKTTSINDFKKNADTNKADRAATDALITCIERMHATINKNAKQNQKSQANIAKTFVKTTKQSDAEKRRAEITSSKTIDKKEKKKNKKSDGLFSFSLKDFLKGLSKILKTIFNPIAFIATLIAEFLPYVLLGLAFFKGVWDGLSADTKEAIHNKLTEVGDKLIAFWQNWKLVIIGAVGAFLFWRKIASFIGTFATVTFNVLRGLQTMLFRRRLLQSNEEFKQELRRINTEKVHEKTEHAAEMSNARTKKVQNYKVFMAQMAAAGIAGMLAAGAMLVAEEVFFNMGDQFNDAMGVLDDSSQQLLDGTDKLNDNLNSFDMSSFSMSSGGGGFSDSGIISSINNLSSKISSILTDIKNDMNSCFNKLYNLFNINVGKSSDNSSLQPDYVSKNIFTDSIIKIVEPLNLINKCLENIYDIINKSVNNTGVYKPKAYSNYFTPIAFANNQPIPSNNPETKNIDKINYVNNIVQEKNNQLHDDIKNLETTFKNEFKTLAKAIESVISTVQILRNSQGGNTTNPQ